MIAAEQSNTSVVFGDAAILKVLPRLFPGANPDLEVAAALARLGSVHVAPPYGWIETELDGEPVLLAVLSRYLARASDGWSLAAASVRGLSAPCTGLRPRVPDGPGARAGPGDAGATSPTRRTSSAWPPPSCTPTWPRRSGPSSSPSAAGDLAGQMTGKLDRPVAAVPELATHADMVGDALRRPGQPDHAGHRPADARRLPPRPGAAHRGRLGRPGLRGRAGGRRWTSAGLYPPLRDVAGMLRSFDYAARHQLLGHPDAGRAARPGRRLGRPQCQHAFCAGYAGPAAWTRWPTRSCCAP